MKIRRKLGYILGACLFALTASGCKETQAKPKLQALNIYVNQYKDYVVGDNFFDYVLFKVEGTYSNGKKKDLSSQSVYYSLMCNNQSYNVYNPLPVQGNYQLYAFLSGIVSNTYNFYVGPDKTYANHIYFDGPNMIGVGKTGILNLDVTPNGYTEEVEYEQGNQAIAYIRQINRFKYEIEGIEMGSTTFTFYAYRSATEKIYSYFTVTIGNNYVSELSTSGPNIIGKKTTTTIKVDVEPLDYTVEVHARSIDENVATVNKVSDTEFEITGVNTGETDIKVYALSNEYSIVETVHHITVQSLDKTEIAQTYLDLNKLKSKYTATPPKGDIKLLAIPIWFTDSDRFISEEHKETVKDDIDAVLFGGEERTGLYSVSSLYYAESGGTLNITGTVANWYSVNKEAQYYANDPDYRTRTLMISAVNDYFSTTGDTRSSYDYDHDGFLDGVVLIFAAADYITYKNADTTNNHLGYGKNDKGNYYSNLWAYKTTASLESLKNVTNPGPNNYIWASYDFMYSSQTAYNHTGFSYARGNTTAPRYLDASCFGHEMGHMFGLKDYYDISHVASHAAGFNVQDNNYGSHDPFSYMALGWADPYIPTETCTITLNDFQSSRELILLTPEFNPYNSPFDEYLLVELYTPTGLNYFDAGIRNIGTRTVGIRLWHVDAILYKTTATNFTRNVFDNGVTYTAFNNTTKVSADGGRTCDAYTKDSKYQNYSTLHLVRRDTTKDYMSNTFLSDPDIFVEGDTFTFDAYKNQFVRYYYENVSSMDFGQQLGWQFTINQITGYGTGQYSANITFTKV